MGRLNCFGVVFCLSVFWSAGQASAFYMAGWGHNYSGQSIVPDGNDFIAVSAAKSYGVAVKSDGSLIAWGANGYGQCNVPDGNDFIAVSTASDHALALRRDGSLVGWGDNSYGQCNAPGGVNKFAAVSAGDYFSIGLKTDGSLIGWGWNCYHQCDVPDGNNFVAISSSWAHSVALRSDGSLAAWGNNWFGECNVPGGNDFIAVSAGWQHSIALRANGSQLVKNTLVAWGDNEHGECNVPDGNDFVGISSGGGGHFSIAIRSDGSLIAWGDNGYGQCDVPSGGGFVSVSAGYDHCLALMSKPLCGEWGYPRGDINRDCRVNIYDFAMMADDWLKCSEPYEDGCVVSGETFVGIGFAFNGDDSNSPARILFLYDSHNDGFLEPNDVILEYREVAVSTGAELLYTIEDMPNLAAGDDVKMQISREESILNVTVKAAKILSKGVIASKYDRGNCGCAELQLPGGGPLRCGCAGGGAAWCLSQQIRWQDTVGRAITITFMCTDASGNNCFHKAWGG